MTLAEHIESTVEFIHANGAGTSLVEIERHLGSLEIDTDGDIAVEPGTCPNLIIWAGMSHEFADVLKGLLRDPRVKVTPTSLLVYLCDGKALNFPVAKNPPKNGYREPHWVPVCFGPNA